MAAALEAQAVNAPGAHPVGTSHQVTLNGILAGEFVAVLIAVRDGNTISSVVGSLNGAYTLAKVQGTTKKAAIYYFPNSAAGNETITVTTALTDTAYLNISRWSGLRTGVDVIDQVNGADNLAGTTHSHGSITTTGAGIILTAAVEAGNFAETPNADFTALTNTGLRDYFQYRIITGAVTTDGVFTTAFNTTSSGAIASFLEPAAAGGGYQFLNDLWW